MITTYEQALERLSERVAENTIDIRRENLQRRDTVVDIYGTPHYAYGDANSPARFYISVSPDFEYYHRFQFKLDIQPFRSTSGSGVGPATVAINDTSLQIIDDQIDPNPHTHLSEPHTHTVNAGITTVPAATSYRLTLEGIDITPYLAAQFDAWPTGEGLYPSTDINKSYDILVVGSDLKAEGRIEDKTKLLQAGFKPMELSSNGPFMATLYLYLKYKHLDK